MTDDEQEYGKAIGQFRMALNTQVLKPLRKYGQGHYVDMALEEIVSLAIQLHHRLSGVDEPFMINSDKLRY